MAGIVGPGEDCLRAERTYLENLRYAAAFLKRHAVAAVIEPINNRLGGMRDGPCYTTRGMHGYFLNYTDPARSVIEQVGSENLYLHLDG